MDMVMDNNSSLILDSLINTHNEYARDRIVVLGRRSSGKTVYLSLLYEKLWRSNGPIKIKATRGVDHSEYIKSANSVRQGIWPPATQGISQSFFEINYNDTKRIMVALDYPGEVFTNAFVKNIESEEVITLLDHIDHAQAVILLVDPSHITSGDIESEIDNNYGLLEAVERIQNWPDGRKVPIVLVLTKIDETINVIKSHGGARKFLKKYFHRLIHKTEHLKACGISAIYEIEEKDERNEKRYAVDIETPLKYCIEKIEVYEKYISEKIHREKQLRFLEESEKRTERKNRILVAGEYLCAIGSLSLLVLFVNKILPFTIWVNFWNNTIGRIFYHINL